MRVSFVKRFALGGLAVVLIACSFAAKADTKIVAIGASNTAGFGTGFGQSYPAQLEAMLKARGYKVQIINAGIPGDTTRGMLARLDASVPADARIVILQPGGNDFRFGYSKEERANNIRAIVARLQKRGIRVIVAGNLQGLLAKNSADGIHFSGEAHALIAKRLYPQVAGALGGGTAAANAAPAANGQPRAALPAGSQPVQAPASSGAAH
jgi:acyl-CoA thioesterase-1